MKWLWCRGLSALWLPIWISAGWMESVSFVRTNTWVCLNVSLSLTHTHILCLIRVHLNLHGKLCPVRPLELTRRTAQQKGETRLWQTNFSADSLPWFKWIWLSALYKLFIAVLTCSNVKFRFVWNGHFYSKSSAIQLNKTQWITINAKDEMCNSVPLASPNKFAKTILNIWYWLKNRYGKHTILKGLGG